MEEHVLLENISYRRRCLMGGYVFIFLIFQCHFFGRCNIPKFILCSNLLIINTYSLGDINDVHLVYVSGW